jgi:hypothetical protein
MRVLAPVALALLVSACAFERTVVNEGVERLDPSGIVAGQSDRLDVLKQLGAPPEQNVEEIGIRAVSGDYLAYQVFERRCFRIGFEEILLITPFIWCFSDYPYRLAVEFDENGIVSGVYATRRDMIWPPFQREADRPAPTTVQLSGDLLK